MNEDDGDGDFEVRLEQVDPDANTAIIKDARVAQALRAAQTDYANRQAENAAAPGPEHLITLRIHSW